MARSIRVLVVDDSALMRQMIARFLHEAGMEVVATARDGRDGLEKALALQPDVITLDVEMPVMNGLDMLRRLFQIKPMPVVMLSSLTQRQAPASIEALALGAIDVVAKPGGGISLNLREVKDELVRKVRVAAAARLQFEATYRQRSPQRPPAPRGGPRKVGTSGARDALVVIGCSTGGPAALTSLIPRLPADFPAPIVIVQHMPPGFTASLAERLDRNSALQVREARSGIAIAGGEAWIAAGGAHLTFDHRKRMRLTQQAPRHGVRPAVDVTLEAVAPLWQGSTVAVILTGMGRDGAQGAEMIKRFGGRVIAQDEESSVVFGMPRAVIERGLADVVCGLDAMPEVLLEQVHNVRNDAGDVQRSRP